MGVLSHFEPWGMLGYLFDAVIVSGAILGRFWGDLGASEYVDLSVGMGVGTAIYRYD